jgi:hypothetical protein
MQEETGKDLVPVESIPGQLTDLGFAGLTRRCVTSISRDDNNYSKRVFTIRQKQGVKIDTLLNKEIQIVAFLWTPATFTDETTGEVVTTLLTKLQLASGVVVETHSVGIAQSIALAAELLGLPTDKRPWICTPVQVKCRGNKSMVTLEFPT